jgi:hypothetical protein
MGFLPDFGLGCILKSSIFLVMNRFRHILAIGLVVIVFMTVATPALVCIIRGKPEVAGHSCCVPVTNIQDSRPEPGSSCCITAADENPSVPAGVFQHAPFVGIAVASDNGVVPLPLQFSSSAPVDDVSPPACCSSSVLRI